MQRQNGALACCFGSAQMIWLRMIAGGGGLARAGNRSAAGFASSLTDLRIGVSRKWSTRGDMTAIPTIFGRVVRCGSRKPQVANCEKSEKPSEGCQVGPCRPLFANSALLLHLRTFVVAVAVATCVVQAKTTACRFRTESAPLLIEYAETNRNRRMGDCQHGQQGAEIRADRR